MEKIVDILYSLKEALDQGNNKQWMEGIRLLTEISGKDLSRFTESPPGSWSEFIRHLLSYEDKFSIDILRAVGLMKEFSILCDLKEIYSETLDKHLKKEIRRIFHRWRTLGISDAVVEEIEQEGKKSVSHYPGKIEAWMSPPDYSGNKHIFIIIPIHNTYLLVQSMVNDIHGINKFSCLELSAMDYKKVKTSIEKMDEMIFPVDPEYAGYEIREASQKNPDSKERPYFIKYESKIPTLKIPKADYLRENLERIESTEHDLSESDTLLDKREFSGFFADSKFLHAYADKLLSLEESRIIVSIHVREEQYSEIIEEAVTKFPDEQRSLYRGRLEDIGLFYLKKGFQNDLRKVVAVIRALDYKKDLSSIPFFREGIKRALMILKNQRSTNRGDSSIIITPGTQ